MKSKKINPKSIAFIGTQIAKHCVHEQVAKLGPVSRAAGMDCECPFRDRASAWHRHWGVKPDGGLSGNKDSRKL